MLTKGCALESLRDLEDRSGPCGSEEVWQPWRAAGRRNVRLTAISVISASSVTEPEE